MPRDGSIDAFGMLRNSHRRLLERLEDLRTAASGPLDDERRATIDDVLGFLGRAVRRHEADEEASLFPRLAAHPEFAALAGQLTAEHATQAELAEALGYALDADDGDTLRRLADDLAASYVRHVEREERELFPAAERLLDDEARAAMLTEMDRRRGR
ncbi:MAG: hemerythrin domain-containing protein [Deltaproteobacteria bacterium]|nr:hemerythrin domain-containing protein [Deltaproteobacteria bacterium]